MLLYAGKKSDFLDDVKNNRIEIAISQEFTRKLARKAPEAEIRAWHNSMQFMYKILDDDEIPTDSKVSIEYVLPLTSKRIDFILTGQDESQRETAVIVELKQWDKVEATKKDAIVKTYVAQAIREVAHPSYQAWTYAALIEDFNETVRQENIRLKPCAYLHNLHSEEVIKDHFYKDHTDKAPVFLASDALKLNQFIKRYVKYGDKRDIMYRIEHGRIRPSKQLADNVESLLKGNEEFFLIDRQKVVYEEGLNLAHKAQKHPKQVLIVRGGPGTGKSVVAINLLAKLLRDEMVTTYVSKNQAPREIYAAKLKGTFRKNQIDNLFKGSGSFVGTESNFFDALLVDEAHRLITRSIYQKDGENQVKEIINASKFVVFFIDPDQKVSVSDIGTVEEINKWANFHNAEVKTLDLKAQFRCNGSDAYISWLNNTLQLRETANYTLEGVDYDFRMMDSPNELFQKIREKNLESNKARMLAGYCWKWKSKKNPDEYDIEFPEYNFQARWNLVEDGYQWIQKPESINEIGCIHTSQGLEIDYVGVIIGPDFIVRDGEVITNALERDSHDATVKGSRKMLKEHPGLHEKTFDAIIKNTYRTLMTRGMKGCYIWCADAETNQYFKDLLAQATAEHERIIEERYPGLHLPVVANDEAPEHNNLVPLYDLQIAAGDFSEYQMAGDHDWVELPDHIVAKEGYFVAQVRGESMNQRIRNGSWCLFRANPEGSRNGKIVLVQHRDIQDQEQGGHFTVKEYHSEKVFNDDGTWEHSSIVLKPKSNSLRYKDIVLEERQAEELKVIGEWLGIVG